MKKRIRTNAAILAAAVTLLFPLDSNHNAMGQQPAIGPALWQKPAGWAATEQNDRKPLKKFYSGNKLESHDPATASDLGLKWQLPLVRSEMGGRRIIDLGGAYCPTLKSRSSGSWKYRYMGIHRGHDIGISLKRIGNKKFPVHLIADGVYDGQRVYTHAGALPKDCRPMVFYHFSAKNDGDIYTSIYCHMVPDPNIKAGQRMKAGDVIGYLEDPEGYWGAHVHVELYSRPVYQSKDSTKFSRCGCKTDRECDEITRKTNEILRGCGIFEDDLYVLDAILFIKNANK